MRILLVDDHELFRAGIKLLLTDLAPDIEFLEAARCADALALCEAPACDVVLLDYHLPGLCGLDAVQALRERLESAQIVVLSAESDPALIRSCIDAGAAGFIPKTSTHGVMMAALRLVLAGGVYLPTMAMVSDGFTGPRAAEARRSLAQLTERQADTLRLAIRGKANKAIARELGITEATVKAHLSAAFRALGVANRTEAVLAAATVGIAA